MREIFVTVIVLWAAFGLFRCINDNVTITSEASVDVSTVPQAVVNADGFPNLEDVDNESPETKLGRCQKQAPAFSSNHVLFPESDWCTFEFDDRKYLFLPQLNKASRMMAMVEITNNKQPLTSQQPTIPTATPPTEDCSEAASSVEYKLRSMYTVYDSDRNELVRLLSVCINE